jgi:hypothetical protein
VNKTNRCTEFQFYWFYYSTCFGKPFCPSSGVLSRTSALVHYAVVTICYQELDGTQFHPKNSWCWAERLPETCRVVTPIKVGFTASVGFIHKESVTTHGHTIVKNACRYFIHFIWSLQGIAPQETEMLIFIEDIQLCLIIYRVSR